MTAVAFQALSKFMVVEEKSQHSHRWAELSLPKNQRDAAAFFIAAHVAQHRCGGAPHFYTVWLTRYQGGPAHAPDLLACLEAYIGSESIGTPAAPASDDHLEGFVAEHIWYLLTVENALNFGEPVRVDGPDWSVSDNGGDGLAIYRRNGSLIFRLWESKAHTGDGAVRGVVNGACRQLGSNALRYLARFSKVGQSLADEELRHFYGSLPQMWRERAREAGGGVSVSTASAAIDDCFGNFGTYWGFAHDDQRQGLVVVVEDYASFAKLVREHLWKGL